jgi:hypothetical protein
LSFEFFNSIFLSSFALTLLILLKLEWMSEWIEKKK